MDPSVPDICWGSHALRGDYLHCPQAAVDVLWVVLFCHLWAVSLLETIITVLQGRCSFLELEVKHGSSLNMKHRLKGRWEVVPERRAGLLAKRKRKGCFKGKKRGWTTKGLMSTEPYTAPPSIPMKPWATLASRSSMSLYPATYGHSVT